MSINKTSLWKALAEAMTGQPSNFESYNEVETREQIKLHGVSQLLNAQIHAGNTFGMGDALKTDLKSSTYQQVASDMLLNDATERLLGLFAGKNIPVLLLKGTPVAHLYYSNSYLRSRCDTDIYIDEDDLENTADLLAAHNYELSGLGTRVHSSKQFVAAFRTSEQSHVHFDVHWKLSNRVMFRQTLPFEDCLESRQPVPQLGPNAYTLSKTDLLIHACIHRIAHGRNTQRNRLIWLFDIHLIVEAMSATEMEGFLITTKRKKVATLCADALEVCQTIFKTSLHKGFLDQLRIDSESEPSARLIDASRLRWAWEDMQSLGSVSEKLAFAKELLIN